jgi:hypothetical protein
MHQFHKFILAWNSVSDSSSVHHQEFIHRTLDTGICHTGTLHTAFEMDHDGTGVPTWSSSKAVCKPVWHILLLNVQWINSWWWTDELSEICRASCQNKFVKLVHLFGFIVYKILDFNSDRRMSETCRTSCQNKFVKLVHLVGFIIYKILDCNSDRRMSETCRASCQNKFVKLVHLVGFVIKK